MFNKSNAAAFGKKGGQAKSARKRKASRANGSKKGGRKPSRSVAERVLCKRIDPSQYRFLERAYKDLLVSERQLLDEWLSTRGEASSGELWNRTILPSKLRRIPKAIQYVFQKFKLAANFYLKEARPPKGYVVERSRRSREEEEDWQRRYPYMPCPPQRRRIYVKELPDFRLLEFEYARNPEMTWKDIREMGGGRWSQKRAEAALALLRYEAEHGKQEGVRKKQNTKPARVRRERIRGEELEPYRAARRERIQEEEEQLSSARRERIQEEEQPYPVRREHIQEEELETKPFVRERILEEELDQS
jgi:hypothetical protein